MHNYPSDITRKEFEIIRADLEGAKKKTKPRKIDLYDAFCAVLYVIDCKMKCATQQGQKNSPY